MIVALALLLAAVLSALTGPRWLGSLTRTVSPVLALSAWIGTVAGVFFLLGSAVVVLIWPDHAPAEGLVELAVRCLGSLQHAVQPWVGETAALAAAAVFVSATVRLTRLARRQIRTRSQVRDQHLDVLAIVARREAGPDPVMWLDHPLPLAYSIDGRPGYIVATAGLAERLDSEQQRAVLLHERAHLRGRHHRIVTICEILAAAFPRVPLFAAAPSAVRMLVELAADRAAAEGTSPEAVSAALSRVCGSGTDSPRPDWALGVFSESTSERLRQLEGASAPGARQRAGAFTAIAMLPLLAPAALSVVALSAVSALACITFQT